MSNGDCRLTREERKKVVKLANRARHRLASIRYDFHSVVQPAVALHPGLPVLCNERCGSWYLPHAADGSCYFKSTDGHVGTWNVSLKRLNLDLISKLNQSSTGACLLLDASKTKEMPDSFSRTIPIWCAVMNRIVLRYRQDLGVVLNGEQDWWDIQLHAPWMISPEEHEIITNLLDDRVDLLYRSHAIVDPMWLAKTLQKPLRPCWITPRRKEMCEDMDLFYRIICVNCSEHYPDRCWKDSFWYTSGAADDHELWGRHLIPRLFWDNVNVIFDSIGDNDDDDVDAAIDRIVANNSADNENAEASDLHQIGDYDAIGDTTGLYVGTRRAGRPPHCWSIFDAILNVTDMEYPELTDHLPDGKWYLQLEVKEGKRDKTELEKWMTVGIVFCMKQLQSKQKVLIHCAQGKDRSVALAMAVIIFCCELHYPLKQREDLGRLSLDRLLGRIHVNVGDDETLYRNSGLSTLLVETLLGRQGRTILLDWYRSEMSLPVDLTLATKETVRIALHLIQEYREKADPSRSTVQKLNRFFMSSPFEEKLEIAHDQAAGHPK
jgi:tRNA A64-2'-O-ribosylphosphate transferase